MTTENRDAPAAIAEKLRAFAARAEALTMGRDTTSSASALLDESEPIWRQVAEYPREMLPVVTTLASELKATLANAPDWAKRDLATYNEATSEKYERVEPPPTIVAFVFLDALERIAVFWKSKSKSK